MDESEVLRFEQQKQITKLSQAIRKGHTMISEDWRGFLSCGRGCALGAAWVGSGKSEEEYADGGANILFAHLIKVFGVPRELLNCINAMHYFESKPRLEIADIVETWGY